MKKIVIHLGRPKTATTTFQCSTFYKLHELGLINCIGKIECAKNQKLSFRIHQNYQLFLKWMEEKHPNHKLREQVLNLLRDDVINVISDEGFSGIDYPRIADRPTSTHALLNAKRFYEMFPPSEFEVEFIMTIRAQVTFIPSLYAQQYYFIFESGIKNLEAFVDKILNEAPKVNSWHHDLVINSYLKYYTKNQFHVLLFEEFIHQPKSFMDTYAAILNIDVNVLNQTIVDQHHNQKVKTNKGTFVSRQNKVAYKFFSFLKKVPFFQYLKVRFVDFSSTKSIKRFYRNVFNHKVLINTKLSPKLENEIIDFFHDSNKHISNMFHISKEKLIQYDYLKKEL
jgi:hypothetical protein